MIVDQTPIVTPEGLRHFLSLNDEAIEAVVGRLIRVLRRLTGSSESVAAWRVGKISATIWSSFDPHWSSGSSDLSSITCDGSRTCWTARGIPANHLALSLDWLTEFFTTRLSSEDAKPVVAALNAAIKVLRGSPDDGSRYERLMPEACEECEAFAAALIRGDQRTSVDIFREFRGQGRTFLEAELHLVQPAMYVNR